MPLYEYECDACGRRFEKIQKFSDPRADTCPHCGGAVHKLMSSPAFHLKGSGWYLTDYAKKGSGSEGKSEGGEKSSDSASKDAKSETKADAKSESKSETKAETKKSETAKPS